MTQKVESVLTVFIMVCGSFGLFFGCIGLGAGLVFLLVPQAIGVGMLSFGCGSLAGMLFGAHRIMKALIETLDEMKSNEIKKAPVSRPAQSENHE